MKFVVFPKAQVDVSIAETINSSAMATFQNLSNVFRPIIVVEFLVVLFQLTISIIELGGKLLFKTGGLVQWLY